MFKQVNPLLSRPSLTVVEEARHEDIHTLSKIHAAGFPRGWSDGEFEQLMANRAVLCLVAKLRGKPAIPSVAFVLARKAVDEAEVITIATDPAYRKKGIGCQLMEEMIRRLQAERIKKLFLEVDDKNVPALSLYKQLGFFKIGERKGYYTSTNTPDKQSSTALVMQLDLG